MKRRRLPLRRRVRRVPRSNTARWLVVVAVLVGAIAAWRFLRRETPPAPVSRPLAEKAATPPKTHPVSTSPLAVPSAPVRGKRAAKVVDRTNEKLIAALTTEAGKLRPCTVAAGSPREVPATIRLRKDGRPTAVTFVRERELPGEWLSCVRSQILRWHIAEPKLTSDTELLVTLVVDGR